MTLLTQIDIEDQMYAGGIARASGMMKKAEEHGRAHQNPYAKEVFADYVLPIAAVIREACERKTAGARAAHVTLLKALDPEAVAFLAVRHALNACMDTRRDATERTVAYKIGTTVNNELVLSQLADHNPELYHTIANDLHRRMSKDERHRMTVFKMQANKAGIDWVEWPVGAKEQVGTYLLGLLIEAGMLELGNKAPITRKTGKVTQPARDVSIHPDVMARVSKIKAFVSITSPVYGPCIEPPLDWTSMSGGGFHTARMRRTLPLLVRCHPHARGRVRVTDAPKVFRAVNRLQRTAWAVNAPILDVIHDLAKAGVATDEIVSVDGPPKPPKPVWLEAMTDKAAMTPEQQNEFKLWKRDVSQWHTDKKLAGTRWGRFYAATRAADMFRDTLALHFVYFADSRGRFYPLTYGVNPQGSDLQKALLHFSKGHALESESAIRWFHIQGANKYGFDKATLSERFMWTHSRREWLLHIAADPINHREWLEAGSPLQFLAWVLEYAAFVKDPDNFRTRLPISMDGSCNGLQNLSAMLRDEVGGRATNLTNNEVMEDIYRRVAEAATKRLAAAVYSEFEDQELQRKWLTHGISRSVVKRSVMTTPYGVTNRSATDYVVLDYLRKEKTPFDPSEYNKAARLLMAHAWPAIGDVVVKGRQAMDWLKKGARAIVQTFCEADEPVVEWTTPSGFPASQAYFELHIHRIRTHLSGIEMIKQAIAEEAPEADGARHASGLAPNFVHSMDASHLHLVAARCDEEGIEDIAMIHDDYGTHANNADELYRIIREVFVEMYEKHDPVIDFFNRYPVVGDPPSRGTLDIREVLQSEYFFS